MEKKKCRLCLKSSGKFVSMLEDEEKLANMFKLVSGLPTPHSDLKPEICEICASELKTAAKVKQLCINYLVHFTKLSTIASSYEESPEEAKDSTIETSQISSPCFVTSRKQAAVVETTSSLPESVYLSAEEFSAITISSSEGITAGQGTGLTIVPRKLQFSSSDSSNKTLIQSMNDITQGNASDSTCHQACDLISLIESPFVVDPRKVHHVSSCFRKTTLQQSSLMSSEKDELKKVERKRTVHFELDNKKEKITTSKFEADGTSLSTTSIMSDQSEGNQKSMFGKPSLPEPMNFGESYSSQKKSAVETPDHSCDDPSNPIHVSERKSYDETDESDLSPISLNSSGSIWCPQIVKVLTSEGVFEEMFSRLEVTEVIDEVIRKKYGRKSFWQPIY